MGVYAIAAIVEPLVDPVAFVVKSSVDSIALFVESGINAVAALVQAVLDAIATMSSRSAICSPLSANAPPLARETAVMQVPP